MDDVRLELDPTTRDAIEARARQRGFASIEAYVETLIADDLRAGWAAHVESTVAKRLDSEASADSTPSFWADVDRRVKARLATGGANRERTVRRRPPPTQGSEPA